MDENAKLNLISEFSKIKNCQLIILTTFNFDPFFFDGFILPLLEKNNRSAQIVILVDEGQYNLAYSRFTNRTGIDYHLIPIRLNNGVFHPKFFFFVSQDSVTTFVGSGNISLQGFTNNAELVTCTHTKIDDGISTITKSILDVLDGLVAKNLIQNQQITELISRALNNLASKPLINSSDFQVLHNLETPIMSQMLNVIPEKSFEKLFVLAPFFSADGKPLSEILSVLKINTIEFGLQKNNHNLKNFENIKNIANSKNSITRVLSAQFLDSSISETEVRIPRRFHSKIIQLENSTKYLFVGSPNFTTEALLQTIDNGNFEFGVLFKDPKFNVLSQITLDESAGSDALHSVRDTAFSFSKFDVRIISVYFDLVKRNMHIICNPSSKTLQVKTTTKEPENTITTSIDFSQSHNSFEISEGIPTEIEIIGDSGSIKRRIFDDSDPVKRLFRSGLSIRTLTENTNELLKIDRFALLDIIRQISDSTLEHQSVSAKQSSASTHNHKYFPSLEGSPKNFAGTLSSFSKLMDSVDVQKETVSRDEDYASDEEIEELSKTVSTFQLTEQSQNIKSLHKIIKKLFLTLASYKKKNPDEDLVGMVILYMKFFIDYSIQIFPTKSASDVRALHDSDSFQTVTQGLFDNLENFFENTSIEDIAQSNSKNLFVITASLSILTGNIINNERFLLCLHKLDFLDKDNYYVLMSYVNDLFNRLEVDITKNQFDVCYSEYGYQFYQNKISDNIKTFVDVIVTEDDDSFLECLLILLEKFHSNYSNYLFKNLDYDKTTKGGKAVYEILGDYEDKHEWMNPW